jgi:lipopolysaccharide transport system ATP-binding protein
MHPALRVEGLAKRYRVHRGQSGGQTATYRTLRDDLSALAAGSWRRLRGRAAAGRAEDFWALKGVDFEVEPGEVVGVIGRNGAGKSTLLKVVSRITRPTAGRVELRGRVGSLLEVGTGFHPELTGRENIYLNGAILGMARREIARKFDEIVAFAAVEPFLETPVKRYSSGMYVRLAFAVAAHLEPEIMLVDEVLAVGDMHFQRKCLDKMGDVARSGRTVLLVSHNMAAIESLCSRVLLIDGGRVAHDGDTAEAIRSYIDLTRQMATVPIAERTDRKGDGAARVVGIEVQDLGGCSRETFGMGEGLRVVLRLRAERPLPGICVGAKFETHNGHRVFSARSAVASGHHFLRPGVTTAVCEIPALPLNPGRYHIHAVIRDEEDLHDRVDQAAAIDVIPADVFGTGRLPDPSDGPCFVISSWSIDDPDGAARPT